MTAGDTFSAEHPGVSEKYLKGGKDIYSVLGDFRDWGICFAERRKEE